MIFMFWRYGEIGTGVDLLAILPGKAYVFLMNISKPPLERVNGSPLLLRHLVGMLMLLNISLYVRNNFCMNFVDFIVISFVS